MYAWMRYFAEPADEFAIVNHPWQPWMQAAHIVLAPLLVLALGMIWRLHVWAKLRANRKGRRLTGWVLALLAFPMVVSGYLLQVASDEAWRNAWIWLHALSSVVWTVAYLFHQKARRRSGVPVKTEEDWVARPNDAFVEPMFGGLGVGDPNESQSRS